VLEPAAEQDYEDFDDPEKARLQKQLAKLQKKLAWAEEQKAKSSRKEWAAEAGKYFQFSNPAIIEAKSRRAFLKEAQRQHEAVAQVAKPLYEQLAAEKARLKEQALAEAREEAAQRWGRPSAGPTTATTLEDTQRNHRERLAQGRSLTDVLKNRIKSGDLKL
jgi:cell division septum initiation protein DivIVA